MTMKDSQEIVFTLIDRLAPNAGSPSIAVSAPSNAGSSVIKEVCTPAYVTEIAKSVVSAVTVDVVNVHRLFPMNKEPCKPVNKVFLMVNGDTEVSRRRFGWLSPSNFARVRIVANDIANRIRNNFRSHAESPLSVVRGLVVGATSTPIIPIVSNIGNTLFASSGGRSGDNLHGPLFINPITL